jgi:hypothetical protein
LAEKGEKMKKNILTLILGFCIAGSSANLYGKEARDINAILEEARRNARHPQITVTNKERGTTSLDGVHFFLCKGRFPATVDGVVVARKSVLREAVNLAASDATGALLLSCPLDAEPEGAFVTFFFTLSEKFVSRATLTFFPKDGVHELQLDSVPPHTETVLGLGNVVEMIAKESKATANKAIDSDKK